MPQVRLSWLDRWSGPVFVVLAFLSAAAVSLPESSDSPDRIRALYDAHRTAYVVAQLAGLVGVGMLLAFVGALGRAPETRHRRTMVSGLALAVAATATNLAVLVLCLPWGLSDVLVHRAAVATDLTDDVLFAAFAVFTAMLALSRLPAWLRALLTAVAALCAARAVEPWWTDPRLKLAAPLLTLTALLMVALRLLSAGKEVGTGREEAADDTWDPSARVG